MKYTVTNIFGIAGESNHRKVEAALKDSAKREGAGWIVVDDSGDQWGFNGDKAVVTLRKTERKEG